MMQSVGYAWGTAVIRNLLFLAVASGMIFNMSVALPLVATRAFHAGARQALGLAGAAVLGTAALGWQSLADRAPVVVRSTAGQTAGQTAGPLALSMDDSRAG